MKSKIKLISLITWLTSITLFIVGIFSFQFFKDNNHWYQTLTSLWLGDIGIGVIAFLILLVASANSGDTLAHSSKNIRKNTKHPKHISLAKLLIITFLILLALLGSGVAISDYMETKKELNNLKEAQMNLSPTPIVITLTPTLSPQQINTSGNRTNPLIDCVGPDGKHMSVTQIDCDTFNNAWKNPQDRIVDCRMQPSCGGQIMQLTKRECDTIICCEVNGKWSTYPDMGSCRNAQNMANPVPTYKSINWSLYYSCSNSASTRLSSAMNSCYPYISQGDNMSYELCKNTANNNYNADLQRCESYK